MVQDSGSLTARVVAVGRAVGVAGRRDDLVADLLPGADRAAVGALRRVRGGQRRRTLAVSAHAGLRMLAVDDALQRALARSDAGTVVVVGAGYDTRAFRLEALRGREVIEIDHPATQASKQRRLPPLEQAVARLTLAGADLATDDLAAVLESVGHDATGPTVWLWEAVVPYLPEAAVEATLTVLSARSAPGSTLVLTTVSDAWFAPRSLGPWLRGPAGAVMRAIGEPILLAESDAAVSARLSRHGFLTHESSGAGRWAAHAGMSLVGPVLDERLHVAEKVR